MQLNEFRGKKSLQHSDLVYSCRILTCRKEAAMMQCVCSDTRLRRKVVIYPETFNDMSSIFILIAPHIFINKNVNKAERKK